MPEKHIDLIIPAKDEAENIPALFDALDDLPTTLLRRVVVCDNGSSDQTARLASQRGAIVVREQEPGYGAACLRALEWIYQDSAPMPNAVAFMDADLADDPRFLERLIVMVSREQVHMAIGARHALAEPGALDPHQRFGNWLSGRLIGLATGRFYRDMGPMRVIRWSTLSQLAMTDRTWGWTVEMQYKAALAGLRVQEHEVPYRRRYGGRSKISGTLVGSAKAGWSILSTISRLWWRTSRAEMRCVGEPAVTAE